MTVLHLGSDMASPCRHCTGTVVHFRAEREAVGSPWDIVATCVACRLSRSTWAWWPGGDRKGMPLGQCTDEEPTAELLRRHLNVIEKGPLPVALVVAGDDVTKPGGCSTCRHMGPAWACEECTTGRVPHG